MRQRKAFLRTVLVFALVMVVTLTGNQGVFAYTVGDDGEPVHEYIVEQAFVLFPDHGLSHLETIQDGAEHEDLKDHVYDRSGACTTYTHFWDLDEGIDDPVDCAEGSCGQGANAWQKAQILWAMAVGEYNSGDIVTGYHYLGHVCHLLADMSVPAHVHEDVHGPEPFEDDCFEDWMTLAHATLNATEKAELVSQGPVIVPDGVDVLYYLFYTTNQVADFFASDALNGDTDDLYGGWMDDIYTELGMDGITSPTTTGDLSNNDPGDNNDDGDLGVVREYSYKYAIRATATLLKYFHDTVAPRKALTVVIDRVVAKDIHDEGLAAPGCYADFFVEVCINDAWYRNEGDQIVDENDISPGWAFARDVGLSGSIPIRIRLWDEDEEPNDDDKSDIDPQLPEGERELNFWVDLATGVISGEDISGTCGTPLVVEGECETDNEESIMTFTVILPNQPPTAHAGDDQTVNEGDTVTLEGTFTDVNAEDTHTFLWHMESSTNGQVIPDSSGPASPEPSTQPFSFIPCDNGVYTFSFTVTDNWGAQDSDTVVVTALNVPPVVTDVYISNQENAEFILPVVHNTSFEGTFTDAGTCDTHIALWDWGDGTTSDAVVAESDGSGTASGSHIYSFPGDYTVSLGVSDDDGAGGSNSMTVHIADAREALDIFNVYIQYLPDSKFRYPGLSQFAFRKMFLRLHMMLAFHNYPGMIYFMKSDLRTKFDGLVGGSRWDDWIIRDLATQTELCQKVDDITAYLKHLLFS
jgi:hypothetical protein